MSGLAELQRRTEQIAPRIHAALLATLQTWAPRLTATAQGYIGHESPAWAPLAESTVEAKAERGQTGRISATDPLYATGLLRESIAAAVSEDGNTLVLTLGSSDPIAVYHELGTAQMPPRPFLARALAELAEAIRADLTHAATDAARAVMEGR